jgi:putative ABC transport system ATP-binding protein
MIEDALEALESSAGDSWSRRLELGLGARGHRVRWTQALVADARALARPDLPVLAQGDDGSFWLLDDQLLGWTRATRLAGPFSTRWLSLRALERRIGEGSRPWASIEPILPASAMSGGASPARRLWGLVRAERGDVAVIVLYAATAGALALAAPIAIQVLINWLAFGALVQPIVGLGLVLIACLTLAAAAGVMQRIVLETLERRIFVRVVADLSARLPRAQLHALDGVDGEELANRFFDVLTLQKAAGTLLLDGVTSALQVIVAVVLLGLYHPWLLLFDLLLLSGMALVLAPHLRAAVDTAVVESKKKYRVAGWIEELTRRPLAFRLGGATALAERRADELAREWLVARSAHFGVYLRQVVGVHALHVLANGGLLVACGALVLRGELTLGQLVAAEFVVAAALLGIVKFTDKLDTVYDLLAGLDKVGALLDVPPELQRGSVTRPQVGGVRVSARGVSARQLRPVSFELEPGSRAAVLAAAGQGKSTLAELVVGVRAPESGRIELDEAPAERWAPDARYGDALLLRIDTLVLSSVRDNLALGRELPDEILWEALRRVGLADRIGELQDGLDQGLGSCIPPSLATRWRKSTARSASTGSGAADFAAGPGSLGSSFPPSLATRWRKSTVRAASTGSGAADFAAGPGSLGSSGSPLSSLEVRALLVARALVIRPRLLVVDGLLDGLGQRGRALLLPPLTEPAASWTLLLLTAEPEVARHTPHTLTLEIR